MTLDDMIASVRGRVDDAVAPYLCSDVLFALYASDAEREACRRSRLIIDSSTAATCSIALVATTPSYALDSRVLFLRRVRYVGADGSVAMLKPVSSRDLDARVGASWETETGPPRAYVADGTTGTFRPYPIPDAAGTVTLTVVRLPLVDLVDLTDTPEIPSHLHAALEHWMEKRYYLMQDAEIFDPKKAATAEAEFEREFGKKSSAIDETWIQREHGFFEDEGVY